MNVCPVSYWLKSVCEYEHSLQEGECRGTAAASDSCVINIRTREGGRQREREGAELERMGGAVLLRNAKHHISSIVACGREKEIEAGRDVEREREGTLPAVGAWCRPASLSSLLISLKSENDSQCTGTVLSTDV